MRSVFLQHAFLRKFSAFKHPSNSPLPTTHMNCRNLFSRVCLFFLPHRRADCKDHQRCEPGISVTVKNSGGALYHDLQWHRRPLLVVNLRIIYKDGPRLSARPAGLHCAPTTTSTGAPTYPTLQSPQIRFNQTTCAVWLGVRKRIISKQRSYSPGFIGIRTGLLCRI